MLRPFPLGGGGGLAGAAVRAREAQHLRVVRFRVLVGSRVLVEEARVDVARQEQHRQPVHMRQRRGRFSIATITTFSGGKSDMQKIGCQRRSELRVT